MGFSSTPLLLILLLIATFATNSSSQSTNFKCTTPGLCQALIDYITPNDTTFSAIETLFSIKNLLDILGANNLPLSTLPNKTIAAQQTIKIPFPCTCSNGIGISDKRPFYIVQSGDGLDHIARDVFSGLTTFQQIAAVNKIPDPDKIEVGQNLTIPLPCSCDQVDGKRVVHYGLLVEAGSTLDSIAEKYGTTKNTLMNLNSIANESSLFAGQPLDVPLRACDSSVNSSSKDYPLLVSNGTYTVTANSCVRCKCDSANNWILQCEPSELRPANSTWLTCPSMACNNLIIGNKIITGCNTTTCAYSGFSAQTIFTTNATISTCPASSPGPASSPAQASSPGPPSNPDPPSSPGLKSPNNYASRIGSSWSFFFISLHLIMLCVHLL